MIKGFAHAAFSVRDMQASIKFYCELCGLKHAFSLKNKNGEPWIEYLSFGGGQFVELFYGAENVAEPVYDNNRIGYHHFCLETKDMTALAKKLFAKGLISKEEIDFGPDGNRSCWAHDPDGNAVEFIQYYSESPLVKGQQTPGAGIAHVAIKSEDREKSLHFYKDVCGFPVQWTLEKDGKVWIYYLQARPGQILELYDGSTLRLEPDNKRAGLSHLCLEVDDINDAVEQMKNGGVKIDSMPVQGVDNNYQAWVKDPDGTRIELMQISPDSPHAKCEK